MALNSYERARVIQRLIERDGQFCHYCGVDLEPNNHDYNPNGWSVDHVIPQSEGGTNHLDNLVLACRRCNQKKKAKDYSEFKLKADIDGVILFIMGLKT